MAAAVRRLRRAELGFWAAARPRLSSTTCFALRTRPQARYARMRLPSTRACTWALCRANFVYALDGSSSGSYTPLDLRKSFLAKGTAQLAPARGPRTTKPGCNVCRAIVASMLGPSRRNIVTQSYSALLVSPHHIANSFTPSCDSVSSQAAGRSLILVLAPRHQPPPACAAGFSLASPSTSAPRSAIAPA